MCGGGGSSCWGRPKSGGQLCKLTGKLKSEGQNIGIGLDSGVANFMRGQAELSKLTRKKVICLQTRPFPLDLLKTFGFNSANSSRGQNIEPIYL